MSFHAAGITHLGETLAPFLRPDFFFVNVGACDGVHADPIYPFAVEHGWAGLAIEPVPHVFEALKANYAGQPQVTCVQAMIGEPGPQEFWYVRDGSASAPWAVRAIGSSDRERVLRSIRRVRMVVRENGPQPEYAAPTVLTEIPSQGAVRPHAGPLVSDDAEDFVESVEVESIPFNECMDRYQVSRIDLLNIDAESFDYEIFCSIDMDRFRPNVLVMETSALDPDQMGEFERRLDDLGFELAHPFGLHAHVYTQPPPSA